jgi:hypothetical protein
LEKKEKKRTEPDSLKATNRNPSIQTSISMNVSSKVDEVHIPLTIFHPQVKFVNPLKDGTT